MPTREFRKDTAQRMTAPSAGVVGTRAWPFLRDREITAHRGPQSLASAERTTASPRVGGAGRAAVPRAAPGTAFSEWPSRPSLSRSVGGRPAPVGSPLHSRGPGPGGGQGRDAGTLGRVWGDGHPVTASAPRSSPSAPHRPPQPTRPHTPWPPTCKPSLDHLTLISSDFILFKKKTWNRASKHDLAAGSKGQTAMGEADFKVRPGQGRGTAQNPGP